MKNNKKYINATIGGISGGIIFGMMMHMMGMMPMIAKMIGSESIAVGWLIHIMISITIGLFFSWWFGSAVTTWARSVGLGMIHGMIWWILGALTIMPLMLGMGVQYSNAFEKMNMMSLMGHMIYGIILGVVYFSMTRSKE